MKKLLFVLFFFISFSSFSQDWSKKIVGNFYSRIDPSKSLQCCDTSKNKEMIKVSFLLPEMVYSRDSFNINQYYGEMMTKEKIDEVSSKLVATYYRKYSDKKIKTLKKSCYTIYISNNVQDDITCDVIYIVGRIYLTIKFE
jgi:hypothetical protein